MRDLEMPDDRWWRAEDLLSALGCRRQATSGALQPVEDFVVRYLDSVEDRIVTQSLATRLLDPNPTSTWRGLDSARGVAVPNHRMIRCVGVGGFGHVWLARHTVTEHLRACKLIPAERVLELDGLKWLKQRVASHPNVFPIEEVGSIDGWTYCLMPLAEDANGQAGGLHEDEYEPMSLRTVLDRRWRVPTDEAVLIGGEVAAGLACLHARGLTHGDVKPSNVLRIDGRWALSDYGLMRESGGAEAPGFTPGYVPPEGAGTQAGDIYALGVVLMMLVTGSGASAIEGFLSAGRRQLRRDGIDPAWQVVVGHLTRPNPGDRPRAVDVAALLDRLGPVGRKQRGRRRLMVIAGVMLGAVALWGAVAGLETYQLSVKRSTRAEVDAWLFGSDHIPVDIAPVAFDAPGVCFEPKIAASGNYVIAITESDEVVAWGDSSDGMCDIPDGIVNPVRVYAGDGMAAVLQADGKLVAWGQERMVVNAVPEDLPPVTDAAILFQWAAIAVLADGSVRGWGEDFACSSTSETDNVLLIPGDLKDVVSIRGGNAHWLVRQAHGSVRGIGCNFNRQLAIPFEDRKIVEFAPSESWTLVLYDNGAMESFGMGERDAIKAPEGPNYMDIASGTYLGVGLNRRGWVRFWGQLGEDIPTPRERVRNVASVFAAGYFFGTVHGDGSLSLWGDNRWGQCDPPDGLRVKLTDPDQDGNGQPDWADALRARHGGPTLIVTPEFAARSSSP